MGGLEIDVEEVRNNSQGYVDDLVGREVVGRGWRKEEVEKGSCDPRLALVLFGRYVAALLPGGFVARELTLTA